MDTIMVTLLRTAIGFFLLLLLTRVLGKKQLGQMTYFTYITGIALGNIAGDMVVHRDIKIIDGITGLTMWTILTIIVEYVSLKSSKARIMLDGEPTIIIKKGVIQEKALSTHRLNMDDVSMLLRNNEVFSLREVDYAILEPNGQLSILKKEGQESVTKKDLNVPISPRLYFPAELIVDGKVVSRNLKEFNLTKEWLENQLIMQNVRSIKDVFFAEIQNDGTVFVNHKAKKG